ncbi:Glyceraldehyde-3-phosphate dehydrogenase 3 [Vibrio stylophorae]|uniref:Glyceraldehyde-3-phosphate dehydrogenase n=1 Tax=Vibrio stylophorae TaxID=659351 RepID=A0ABM8ZVW9_9VIBR|nr:ArsJ-associated glyceraldehyde-3-phosphate dehydrogenase [Vibrio stylophorae]CAH0534167.1 Glyceraldehyde-3-phosphate dehydrogenase 3 [Vibrio stylophorae]
MTLRVGINGFGRIGRLVLRHAFDWPEIEFVQINDVAGDSRALAHLIEFDSVQGRWPRQISHSTNNIEIDGQRIHTSQHDTIEAGDWSNCDIVIEATGVHRSPEKLQAYFDQGVQRVVVTAPVKSNEVANIVYSVNHHIFDPAKHRIVTAASCTTNCIAPVIQALSEKLSIQRASFTTIHDLTNTQTILDAPHKDLRRARACGMSLIPTTTGSAKAIIDIFPALKGKIDGHAVRVPLANASLTDLTLEFAQTVTVEQINTILQQASEQDLKGILGFETKPLVSIDYRGDQRSTIIDALSTMVVDDHMVKLYAWYDNEMGYACRTADLMRYVAQKAF